MQIGHETVILSPPFSISQKQWIQCTTATVKNVLESNIKELQEALSHTFTAYTPTHKPCLCARENHFILEIILITSFNVIKHECRKDVFLYYNFFVHCMPCITSFADAAHEAESITLCAYAFIALTLMYKKGNPRACNSIQFVYNIFVQVVYE